MWQGGFRNEIRIRDLRPLHADEPANLGGTDTAPNPVEQILGAFGACLAIGYTAGANGQGIDLRGLELDLTGIIDLPVFLGLRDGQAGFREIDQVVRIESDASPEALVALHEAVLRTSPVGNTLERPVVVHARLEPNGRRLPPSARLSLPGRVGSERLPDRAHVLVRAAV